MARRSSRPRASSRRCAGACSPATRTTPTNTLTDPAEAAPPRAHRRRPEEHARRRRPLVHQPEGPSGRARNRPPSRNQLQAHGPRLAGHRPQEEGGRERDSGARTGLVTQTRTSRAAGLTAPKPAPLTRHRLAPTKKANAPQRRRPARRRPRIRKIRREPAAACRTALTGALLTAEPGRSRPRGRPENTANTEKRPHPTP
jgi:hypothetical protein